MTMDQWISHKRSLVVDGNSPGDLGFKVKMEQQTRSSHFFEFELQKFELTRLFLFCNPTKYVVVPN